MGRKNLMQLRALVRRNAVVLTFYKGTPFAAEHKEAAQVRILRREEPDFIFGESYAEFFDGLTAADAEVVFEDLLAVHNGRKFTFIDDTVEVGRVYVYWAQLCDDTDSVGPVAVKVRDQAVWWPYETVRERLDALAAHSPLVEVCEFGRSVRGVPMVGALAGNRERMVAFVGAVHAGESGPELLVPALERLALEAPELLEKVGMAVFPTVDVDAREDNVRGTPWYLRTNANGVDLNRNFDADWLEIALGYGLDSSDPDAATYRGPAPHSEPETGAVVKFVEGCRPCAVFCCHCLASICGDTFLVSQVAKEDTAFCAEATTLASAYAGGMYPEREGEASLTFGCSSGSLPHWLYRKGIPAFDLELGTNEDARPCIRDETTPELLAVYQERHAAGIRRVLEHFATRAD
ncbi:MAG: hypothetical protein KAI66_04670 [Lentisphaeria bacterium]|nr:hypothetical protein [Lentisphaeria bacterium]